MSWDIVKLSELITESRIPSENPDPDRRITVRLNVLGVEKRPLENEKAGATKQFIRKAGQFIYGKQNFHKGAFGIIPEELDGFESSADLPAFDVREDCLPEWIFYFFKQGGYYLELAKIARGVATQRIHPEQIYDLEIPLPDIETQKNIIASIKAIEGKGAKLNNEFTHQLTLLAQLEQAILQEAVQGKLVPQDPNDEPASELLKRIKAEKATLRQAQGKGKKEKPLPPIKPEEIPFQIPENWVWCRLIDIITILGDGLHGTPNYDPTGEYYFINGNNLINGKIEIKDSTKRVSESEYLKYRKPLIHNTVFVSINGTLGNLAYYNGEKIILGKSACYFNLHQDISREYIGIFIKSSYFLKYAVDVASETTIKNVSLKSMRMLPIPLPPLTEQKRIVAEIEKQLAKTKQLKEHIIANQQATEQLLKALLHQAFEVKEMEDV